jgi:hypothetical protein
MTTVQKHQLVTHDGELPEDALAAYLDTLGAGPWNRGYQVVAIMGPQSSGKSTLMNHVFGKGKGKREGSWERFVFLGAFCMRANLFSLAVFRPGKP